MEDLKLQANKRSVLGKKTRFLRRQGITPTHLFGHSLESIPLQCDTANLQRVVSRAGKTRLISLKIEEDKKPRNVFIREIQRNVFTGTLLHVDFYQIRMEEKIKADIPIILVGEAPAMKEKGRILIHTLDNLSIECLPDKLPPQLEIDLSLLEDLDQAIHVRDIAFGPDITLITDPDQMVVKVSEVHVEKVEEVEEGVVEEVEEEVAAEDKAEVPVEEASER